MKRSAFTLLLYLLSSFAQISLIQISSAQNCSLTQSQDLMSRKERSHLFAEVWTTVKDEYIYTDYRGVDWEATRKDYGARVLTVKTNEEFYSVVDGMILGLGDDHSVYLSPWLSCEEDGYDEEDTTEYEPTVTRLGQDPSVLLIDLPSFDLYDTGLLLEAQLRRALQKGHVSAVMVDLRHNYGGYLDAAYEVLSHFVRGRLATEFDVYGKTPTRGEPGTFYREFSGLPMVVLVDADTHSAAELTAGILQQTHHATVIGQTSAGNTEILLPFDFEDGSRLWLAIGGFTLADGTNLEGIGVIPDILIATTALDDVYIEAGLAALALQGKSE